VASRIDEVYREEGQRLWRALLAYCGDPEIAKDSLSEAFAQAIKRGDAVRDPRSWIWRSAHKIAAGALKKRSHEPSGLLEGSYDLDPPAIDLIEALRSLPKTQRVAVVLHYAADYPVADVAAILGTSVRTVKMHLHRGRKRLAEILGDEYEA